MGCKTKLKKAEQEANQSVEKLKKSIKEQFGIDFKEWIKREKEKINDDSNGKSRA